MLKSILNFFSSPYLLALNTIITFFLAFLTIRDKYLTFAHFKVEDFKTYFFKEGLLVVDFEIVNTSQVPFSFKSISLIVNSHEYSPFKPNSIKYFYQDGYEEEILSRLKTENRLGTHPVINRLFNQKNIEKPLQYREFIKLSFAFSTNNPNLLQEKAELLLISRESKKKILVSDSVLSLL